LDIAESYDSEQVCTNEDAGDEQLLYLDSTSSSNKIKVMDEEVVTFYLEVPPGGTYVESNSVMVDRAEVGVEWQSDYGTYDPCSSTWATTLNCSDDFSEGFYDKLGSSPFEWYKNFNNGDLDSKESHWKAAGDSDYVDSVDIAVWCGHGPVDATGPYLRFFVDKIGGVKQPPDKLYWSEIDWGNDDVEWVILNTCRYLNGTDTQLKQMAYGVHLICGYKTRMDVFCAAGAYFADECKR